MFCFVFLYCCFNNLLLGPVSFLLTPFDCAILTCNATGYICGPDLFPPLCVPALSLICFIIFCAKHVLLFLSLLASAALYCLARLATFLIKQENAVSPGPTFWCFQPPGWLTWHNVVSSHLILLLVSFRCAALHCFAWLGILLACLSLLFQWNLACQRSRSGLFALHAFGHIIWRLVQSFRDWYSYIFSSLFHRLDKL